MPLTPEDVSNKRFTPVRLREGYDMGEVDQFLDEVEAELGRLTRENDDLRAKLSAAQSGAVEAAPVPEPVVPEPVAAVFAGNRRGMQPGLEQIVEVVGWECRQPIVLGRPRSEAIGSQRRRAFDERLSAARKSEVDHHDCQSDLVAELAPVRVGPVAAAVSIESTLAGNSTLYPP